MFYSRIIYIFAIEMIFIVELKEITMKKNTNKIQTSLVEELVKQRPILTEEEMSNFCTYEEVVADALQMFDEMANNIIQQNGQNSNQ